MKLATWIQPRSPRLSWLTACRRMSNPGRVSIWIRTTPTHSGPAATALFLRNGYLGTSMDEIAALAGVSKQTVYTHFADKERLFTELVLGNTERVDEFVDVLTRLLGDSNDVARDLGEAGRRYVRSV